MTALHPNLKHLQALKAEARQLRAEGRLTLEETRRILLAAKAAAGDLSFDVWFEPLAVALPLAHTRLIVPQL
jgi:hypothetical protein